MSLIDILLTTAIITLFCLGIRTLLSEGMLLHRFRKPFEYDTNSKVMNFLRTKLQLKSLHGENSSKLYEIRRKYIQLSTTLSIYLKPIVLCVVCFSSVWGSLCFIALHGLTLSLLPGLFISCISSAFIIKVINDKIDF